jgi:hypothetical protein
MVTPRHNFVNRSYRIWKGAIVFKVSLGGTMKSTDWVREMRSMEKAMNRSKPRRWFLSLLLVLLFCHPAQALDIEYPSFTPGAIKDFQLNGEAVDLNPNDDELLRLTGKTTSSVGSAFLKQPVSLGPDGSFKTFFQFMMNAPTTPGADGFAFTIQNDSRGAAAMGPGGGYLGYKDIRPSLAVEFDTFLNDTWDPKVEQHVAILGDGSVQNHLAWAEARGLNDGNKWFVWIEYDGVTKIMEVRFSSTGDRPKDPQIRYHLDLLDILKGDVAYLGFTAGTGGYMQSHNIIYWQFSTNGPPVHKFSPAFLLLLLLN